VVSVETGLVGNNTTEVTSGLTQGQSVVLSSATTTGTTTGGFPRLGGGLGRTLGGAG
jgi:hypothetical protein